MLKIIICDDNKEHAKELKSAVEHIIFSRTDYQIRIYTESDQLMQENGKELRDCELLFLDIHMPDYDGISVAKFIRENEIDLDIIFYSISQEHIFEGFTYKAFTYLLKPLDLDRLKTELERYFSQKEEVSSFLHVTSSGTHRKLPLKNVKYFTSEEHKIYAVTTRDRIGFYEKMDAVYEAVEADGFVRCHQSYIVNIAYVSSFNRTSITLMDGDSIPVSRAYQKVVKGRLEACM